MKLLLPIVCAVLTGLFWGTYGAVLAQSRAELKSPFIPYLMIGLAYLVIGVGGGVGGMLYRGDSFTNMSLVGLCWGFGAGALGACGAFTLTLAMYSGGGPIPHVVMTIVFGTAVTVAAIIGASQQRELPTGMILGMILVGAGVVLTAANTPHQHPPTPKPAANT